MTYMLLLGWSCQSHIWIYEILARWRSLIQYNWIGQKNNYRSGIFATQSENTHVAPQLPQNMCNCQPTVYSYFTLVVSLHAKLLLNFHWAIQTFLCNFYLSCRVNYFILLRRLSKLLRSTAGPTWSRGRCWAAIRLSHCPERQAVQSMVRSMDFGGQHGRRILILPGNNLLLKLVFLHPR